MNPVQDFDITASMLDDQYDAKQSYQNEADFTGYNKLTIDYTWGHIGGQFTADSSDSYVVSCIPSFVNQSHFTYVGESNGYMSIVAGTAGSFIGNCGDRWASYVVYKDNEEFFS